MNSTTKYILIILVTAAVIGAGTYLFLQNKANSDKASLQANIDTLTAQVTTLQKQAAASTTTSTNTTTKTPAPVATETWKTYTNTDYKFSLTFGDIWKGYEVKKLIPADKSALAYYYFNMPTTDTDYAKSTDSTSAGFASIFAFSVYTPAQWAALQAEGGPLTAIQISGNTNASYIFAYQHGQAYPQSLSANATNITTVIASFKNN